MKPLILFIKLLAFVFLTTLNFEFLINRQDSTFLLLAAIAVQMLLIYILIYSSLKQLLK